MASLRILCALAPLLPEPGGGLTLANQEQLAALWNGAGEFDLAAQSKPEPAPHEVVLQVGASGICGSDLYFYGILAEPEVVPGGHEVAGTVIAAGDDVSGLAEGDRVTVEMVGLSRACMKCWFCRAGEYVKCMRQSPRPGGGFATYMAVPEQACFRLPPSLSWEQAALVEPVSVSLHGVRLAEIKSYETAVVLGAGTIGLMCIASLSAMGVGNIIASAKHPGQADMARRLGAAAVLGVEDEPSWLEASATFAGRGGDRALPARGSPLWDRASADTSGRGADVVFECVGGVSGGSLAQATSIARKGGRVVSIGSPKVPVPISTAVMLQRELRLIMSHCYSVIGGRHDYEVAMGILESGTPPVEQIVTGRFPLARINEAFDAARQKSEGSVKVLLMPDG